MIFVSPTLQGESCAKQEDVDGDVHEMPDESQVDSLVEQLQVGNPEFSKVAPRHACTQ